MREMVIMTYQPNYLYNVWKFFVLMFAFTTVMMHLVIIILSVYMDGVMITVGWEYIIEIPLFCLIGVSMWFLVLTELMKIQRR